MADERMTFVLEGRDRLSRTLDNAGDSAERMARRIDRASQDSSRAIEGLHQDANGRLRDARGRFVSMGEGAEGMGRSVRRGSLMAQAGMADLRSVLVTLAPAAVPVAASLVPIAAAAGAASVAMAAFGAAVVPQISAMSDAAKAQTKYSDAVRQHGKGSQQAAQAETEYLHQISQMPPATRKATAALSVLSDTYKGWSNSLASSTMPAFTQGLQITTALLPKLTGVAKGAGTQLQRLTTLAGGAIASPGFDRLMGKFTTFTNGVLQRATDAVVHFFRLASQGNASGLNKFMDYARSVGPQVADTLKNLARAVGNILEGASQAGGGILTLVNALAKMVAALPPAFVGLVLQMAAAFKIAALAGRGMDALAGVMFAVRTEMTAASTAAAGATTTIGGLRAAFLALSSTAKMAVAATGIGLLVVALTELSDTSRKAPDVDKMATSLSRMAMTGKASGEAARVLGKNFGEFNHAIAYLSGHASGVQEHLDKLLDSIHDTSRTSGMKEIVEGTDKALASLVSSGRADQARIALEMFKKSYAAAGHPVSELTGHLKEYKSALLDQKFEQELAARSMGLFGDQAIAVQQKLDAQRRSTDGLRQSLIALNEVNRAALSGRAGMEEAIDNAAKATKNHANALRMVNGELDLSTPKAREASAVLTDLADKTDKNVTAARENGRSWEYAKSQYDKGKAALIRAADAMGLTHTQAVKLAGQILKTPNKTAYLKGDMKDLQGKIDSSRKQLKGLPDSRQAKVRADIRQAEAALARIKMQLAAIKGKTVSVTTVYKSLHVSSGSSQSRKNYAETYRSRGGPVPGYASGGHVQAFDAGGYISGPGTSTSDSIMGLFSGGVARVSDSEYVVRAAAVRKYGVGFLDAINQMRLGAGNTAGAGVDAVRGLVAGMASGGPAVLGTAKKVAGGILAGVKSELQIASPSKKMKALGKEAGNGLIVGLTGTKAKIKSTADHLAKSVWATFSGRTDNRLAAMVYKGSARLQSLAGQRDALATKLADAKKYASDTATAARGGAELPGVSQGTVTAAGVQSFLAGKLAQIKGFSSLISKLASRGLSKTLLRQILNLGPEQGYAYAKALSTASAGTLHTINSSQYQIDKAATSLGNKGADLLYDSGKNAGKGLLKGLESQKADIEKLMLSIAKGMQKSIRRALGIKSPSRVMAELGRYSTEGLAVGLRQRIPMLDRSLSEVTSRVAAVRPAFGVPTAGMPLYSPAPVAASAPSNHVTYNVYPQKSNMDVRDWQLIQRQEEARWRVGRAH